MPRALRECYMGVHGPDLIGAVLFPREEYLNVVRRHTPRGSGWAYESDLSRASERPQEGGIPDSQAQPSRKPDTSPALLLTCAL